MRDRCWILHRLDPDDVAGGTAATGPLLMPGEEVKVVPLVELREANTRIMELQAKVKMLTDDSKRGAE